ncbi:amino acid adenylation domain-containing protein [Nonomuraea sp. NPDC052116]|uniref:non-ribosomal peptide synthetase n=1 Tax=Nonomuraea sp. NPDC052116 TaxID=3155665 RepID=UPI0034444F7B
MSPIAVTRLPFWTPHPQPGVAGHVHDLREPAAAVAGRLGVPLGTLLLAVHAKVLSALTGEGELTVGFVPTSGGPPRACRVTVREGSWSDLLHAAGTARTRASAADGEAGSAFASVLDLAGWEDHAGWDDHGAEPGDSGAGDGRGAWAGPGAGDDHDAAEPVLRIGLDGCGGGAQITVRYRRDAFDAPHAARIAGYHAVALERLAADPAADHDEAELPSAEELSLQVHGMAGPARELPDRRFHELFEERSRAYPDRIAAVCGDERLTYAELNRRANLVARALVAHGVGREDVVGVVTGRDLGWMAAVIGVFKAGGVYLPVEPGFPASRIEDMLVRSACRVVLTDGAGALTGGAAAGVPRIHLADALSGGLPDSDLGLRVDAGQLAYIYFTSGSTGLPKGAMCEHAGMLNHLLAKIEDLGVEEGHVVAQIAPQCFDISLWQLLAALLVGGRTYIVEQEALLDPRRFADRVEAGEVDVLQVVPSHLDALLGHLAGRAEGLSRLRCVSVTGEALRKDLAERWFAAFPQVRLVNAYGLTETSDDTNHEVMTAPPAGDRVPLGRPIRNVHVYVVDDRLRPVPLGAPGEIVFSGVCVGRGYVNDEGQTRRAFLADPHRPGQRLYRSGDFGRWQPDGKLEFLGRRDAQVKINGYRIEIGEIESRLLRAPGVHEGAVVVRERPASARLLAFYAAPPGTRVQAIRDSLAAVLPPYMVPAGFYWLDRLPLTGNGKIDRKRLERLAGEFEPARPSGDPPRGPAELRLAASWEDVLGLAPGQAGRGDHFFEQGGTSLAAVRLAAALDWAVTFEDLVQQPTLAGLAERLDAAVGGDRVHLHRLAGAEDARAAVVCFPYAGGSAVNYRLMAAALPGDDWALYAVEPPGQGPFRDGTPYAEVPALATCVAAEIDRLDATDLVLWGHSSGTAPAIETTRLLEARGRKVRRLFLAAQLLGDLDTRQRFVDELAAQSDEDIAEMLVRENAEAGVARLDLGHALLVAPAYRHDATAAGTYFAGMLRRPPVSRLATPVSALIAADDPTTAGYRYGHRAWELLAERVTLHELADGGHYFLHTRTVQIAALLNRTDDPA